MRIAFSGKIGSGVEDAVRWLCGQSLQAWHFDLNETARDLARDMHDTMGLTYADDTHLLQTIREWSRRRDPQASVSQLAQALVDVHRDDPVYVSGVCYRDEAAVLRSLGFVLVRLDAGVRDSNEPWRKHASETDLDSWPHFDYRIVNCREEGHLEKCLEALISEAMRGYHLQHPQRMTRLTP